MSSVALRAFASRGLSALRENAAILAMFAAALFLSALLLFSVQPIFAKMVLPKLGGSPSVWAVSMVFFQAVLLAGYAYAYALNRWCPKRQAPMAHVTLMALAVLALPFGLPGFAAEPPAGDAYLWLIGVLLVGVGLPFFAVSANAPLLQSWFARSGHPQAADPYFLYGASNMGSLIALLAYPIAIEPVFGLTSQAAVWTGGFVVLAVLIGLCGLLVVPAQNTEVASAEARPEAESAALTWGQGLHWLWLAAIPSGLLVSFTSYVTTDIASAPFLWVIPLAVFLATFILVFRDTPVVPHHWMVWSQPLLIAMTLLGIMSSGATGWVMGVTAGFAAFFATTMICHKMLYDQRPASQHLTAFYMWMSLGGVVGGVFAALIAPQIFNAIYEFPMLLLAGLATRIGMLQDWRTVSERQFSRRLLAAGTGLVAGLALAHVGGLLPEAISVRAAPVVVLLCGIYLLVIGAKPLRHAVAAGTMGLALMTLPSEINSGFAERSFFGVHRVSMHDGDQMRLLLHGTTLHGAMRIKDAAGQPVAAPLPATYYYPGSPMARGVEAARQATGKSAGGLVVGSVGVGAGSIACYSRPNETWSFYEIDPIVVKLATNPKIFTFFSRCRPEAAFVLGDARLTLAKAAPGAFDYLIIDAFASDSIPVHLLTKEAVELYLSRLSPHGILALHISNRHMDLDDVAQTVARAIPGTHAVSVNDQPTSRTLDELASRVMFLSRSSVALDPIRALNGAKSVSAVDPTGVPSKPWTDDYSNVLRAIWRAKGH
jgi:hypothetical protein